MSAPKLSGVDGPEIFAARLATVREMCSAKGWDNADGDPVADESWDRARSVAEALDALGVPWPFLYPSNEGGAQLEWDAGPWAISLEITPAGVVYIDATDCRGDGGSHDTETMVDDAAEALVSLLRQAGITWGAG